MFLVESIGELKMKEKNIDFTKRFLPAPKEGGFKMEGYWVWCGSVIKAEDGRFHMFASRWPKSLPMHPGWLLASEIVRADSMTPEGPYVFQEVVLKARGAEFWDGRATHNPHITKVGDTYVLYYIGYTHPFLDVQEGEKLDLQDPRVIVGRSNKRVGIAISQNITGPWIRSEQPILSPRPGKFDSFFTSNPAPCFNEDGSVLLVYKTRAYNKMPYRGQLHGSMSFGVATSERYDGKYEAICDQSIFPPDRYNFEDPFVWKTESGYEMIAKDMNGTVCGEQHGGISAFSKNGMDWVIREGIKSYSRKIKWDDGTEQIMGSLERPFILFQEGKATHLFFATADGVGGFTQATNTWNMVIPLCE